jgi:hypothetical protein
MLTEFQLWVLCTSVVDRARRSFRHAAWPLTVFLIEWSWIMPQFLYNVRTMGLSDTLRCELRNLALILRLTKNTHISSGPAAALSPAST